jgi:membrane protein
MKRLKTLWVVVRATIQAWTDDNAAQMAAAIAYYTVFSIPPLLFIALIIAGNIFDTVSAQNHLISQINGIMGVQTAEFVKTILEKPPNLFTSPIASVFSFVVLLTGASGFFSQIQYALNIIWKVPKKQDLSLFKTIKNRFITFLLILVIGLLFLVVLILSVLLSEFIGKVNGFTRNVFLLDLINFLVLLITITILIAIIFRVIPDKGISWTDVWLGATVTGLLFMLGKFGIGFYLSISNSGTVYGAAGSLIVLLIWVYYSTQIFLLGAEFTRVFSKRFGSRKVPLPITKFGIEKIPDQNE